MVPTTSNRQVSGLESPQAHSAAAIAHGSYDSAGPSKSQSIAG